MPDFAQNLENVGPRFQAAVSVVTRAGMHLETGNRSAGMQCLSTKNPHTPH